MRIPAFLRSVVVIAVVAAGLGFLLGHLRTTAPRAPLEVVLEGAIAPVAPETDRRTCQRGGAGSTTEPDILPDLERQRIRSAFVAECPSFYDGKRVMYAGEVVGDVLRRDGGAWLLVNDDSYALELGPLPTHADLSGANTGLAVWLPTELGIDPTPGGPSFRGDVLLIQGTIARTDPEDGGGLTLRAESAEILAEAQRASRSLHSRQAIAAAILVVLATGGVIYERRTRDRR